jgi:energy-coupling factor transporter ATP-binding protein EcfA2
VKIREVQLRNYRNVGDTLRRVSFVDPETDEVRPLTVLVGSNGSGKTTLFEVIEEFAEEIRVPARAGRHFSLSAYIALCVDFGASAPAGLPREAWFVRGPKVCVPGWVVPAVAKPKHVTTYTSVDDEPLTDIVAPWIREMTDGSAQKEGGILYFPHERWITHEQRAAIENPKLPFTWNYSLNGELPVNQTLERQWVWENYLDLEAGLTDRTHLRPFVETIETILGQGRQIKIKEGIVWIHGPDGPPVQPHQLPSGEQQILTLFGELARRIRPGAVLMIDEIELSLHPALQHVVIDALRRLGRQYDLQIIVSTHSMEIVNAVDLNEVINLDQFVLAEQKARKAS